MFLSIFVVDPDDDEGLDDEFDADVDANDDVDCDSLCPTTVIRTTGVDVDGREGSDVVVVETEATEG